MGPVALKGPNFRIIGRRSRRRASICSYAETRSVSLPSRQKGRLISKPGVNAADFHSAPSQLADSTTANQLLLKALEPLALSSGFMDLRMSRGSPDERYRGESHPFLCTFKFSPRHLTVLTSSEEKRQAPRPLGLGLFVKRHCVSPHSP